MAEGLNEPTTPSVLQYKFLDKDGVQKLSETLLTVVKTRMDNRMVSTITAGDTTHVPTAAAVYTAIQNAAIARTYRAVTGQLPETGETNIIYLQRDDEEDTTWETYLYDSELGWICIGKTEVDLTNYWSKDDTDEMKTTLGINDKLDINQIGALEDEDIENAVDAAITNVSE